MYLYDSWNRARFGKNYNQPGAEGEVGGGSKEKGESLS